MVKLVMAKVVAVIPARIDSSRFPSKMIADETGKPLIQYAYEVASRADSVNEVYLATDSKEIAEVAHSIGAQCIMTGEHPNGTSRIAEAVRDIDCDVVVNMQGDEPELDPVVIDEVVSCLGSSNMATAVCELRADELNNENVVKAILDGGNAVDFTRSFVDGAYRHIGLYVYQAEFLQTYVSLEPTASEIERRLEQMRAIDSGYSIAAALVNPQPGGIDTPEQYAEFVKSQSLL